MCMSAITWAGFDNFHYFFSHEDSRDAFAIPHDLKILKEVFGLEPGGYRRRNAFWQAHAIDEGIETQDEPQRSQSRARSEEHTSELQSLMRISYAVFCLKTKKQKNTHHN